MNTEFYQKRKKSLVYLIRHYEMQLLNYLDYAAVNHMTLDELTILYNYDENKQEEYQGQLLILEIEKQLSDLSVMKFDNAELLRLSKLN